MVVFAKIKKVFPKQHSNSTRFIHREILAYEHKDINIKQRFL